MPLMMRIIHYSVSETFFSFSEISGEAGLGREKDGNESCLLYSYYHLADIIM